MIVGITAVVVMQYV